MNFMRQQTTFTVECPAHRHKNKSKAAYDVFGPEHENALSGALDLIAILELLD